MTELVLSDALQSTDLPPGPWVKDQHIADCEVISNKVWVRRNRNHWVGRFRIPNSSVILTATPDFDASLFADFFVYAKTRRLPRLEPIPSGSVMGSRFAEIVADIFVDAVEADISYKIARRYRTRVERSHVLRGRPLWTFGRPAAAGIDCRIHLLDVDNLLNRLVLAGLRVAHRLLRSSKSSALLYEFRSLCSEVHPCAADFERAHQTINALTSHYTTALELSRSLVLQLDPDLFNAGGSRMVGFELYVPRLFEEFLHNLVSDAYPDKNVVEQLVDDEALVDGLGDTYRNIRPDTIVKAGDVPLAVLDAKYKPQYMETTKASTADLYQLFFYQGRLQDRAGLGIPPAAAIVAPSFGAAPQFEKRIVHRRATASSSTIYVLDLPLENVVAELAQGARAALRAAPELDRLLLSVCDASDRTLAENRNSVIFRAV